MEITKNAMETLKFDKNFVVIPKGATINYTTRSRNGDQIIDEQTFVSENEMRYAFNTYRKDDQYHYIGIGSIKNSMVVLKIKRNDQK